ARGGGAGARRLGPAAGDRGHGGPGRAAGGARGAAVGAGVAGEAGTAEAAGLGLAAPCGEEDKNGARTTPRLSHGPLPFTRSPEYCSIGGAPSVKPSAGRGGRARRGA